MIVYTLGLYLEGNVMSMSTQEKMIVAKFFGSGFFLGLGLVIVSSGGLTAFACGAIVCATSGAMLFFVGMDAGEMIAKEEMEEVKESTSEST